MIVALARVGFGSRLAFAIATRAKGKGASKPKAKGQGKAKQSHSKGEKNSGGSSLVAESSPNSLTSYKQSDKLDILKTYLEIIPPYRVLEIVESKEKVLEGLVRELEKNRLKAEEEEDCSLVSLTLDPTKVTQLHRYLKKYSQMVPTPMVTRILALTQPAELELEQPASQTTTDVTLRKIYLKCIQHIKANSENLRPQHLVDLVYTLAKLNRKEFELFKEVEKVLLEEKLPIRYHYLKKVIFAYTHLNLGSSVLYSHVSKTVLVGQYELEPLQLGEFAYMLSKVSENAKGGYGVFQAAEKAISDNLGRMDFKQLVKVSGFMLVQDLGSNAFQSQVENALAREFPSKDRLKLTQLVSLLKSTSGYYFKGKELLGMLDKGTRDMAEHASVEQLEEIVWSWGRLAKGDQNLWLMLEHEVQRRLGLFKPRGLSFVYYSLSKKGSVQILRKLQTRFGAMLGLGQIKSQHQQQQKHHPHYMIKVISGMSRRKLYENGLFVEICTLLSQRIGTLSNHEFMTFIHVINESDIDYESTAEIKPIVQAIEGMASKLLPRVYTLQLAEIVELAFMLTKLQIPDEPLMLKCLLHMDDVKAIPKAVFIKAIFVCVARDRNEKVWTDYVPILRELVRYGPIGYFFTPYEFPLLAYALIHLTVNGQLQLGQALTAGCEHALDKINPAMLNHFVRKGYDEANRLRDRAKGKSAQTAEEPTEQ